MKAVMFSINRPHTDNIRIGAKTSELRTRPPKIYEPYKAYIYEPLKNGGCGKVIGEFTAFNENTYRMCMGVPKNLVICGCISVEEIWTYTNNGKKDLTEISISDLVIYDTPKELSEFYQNCTFKGNRDNINDLKWIKDKPYLPLKRPPQSWCYVERLGEG